jgi:hypothetical protein
MLSRYNITATGNSVLPLKCGIQYENNVCTSPDFDVVGIVASRDILPQFEIDPPPTTGGCTIESIYTPHYAIEDITLDFQDSPADPRSAIFRFWLHADHALSSNNELIIENSINISSVANSPSAQTWIDSIFVSNPLNTLKCRFKYDFAINHFTLDHEWLCSDKDPNNPYVQSFLHLFIK